MTKDLFYFCKSNGLKMTLVRALTRRLGLGATLMMIMEHISPVEFNRIVDDIITENYNSLDDFIADDVNY